MVKYKCLARCGVYIVLILLVIPMVLPLLWMGITAVTPEQVFYEQEGPVFIPSDFRWENIPDALSILPFHKFVLNTIIYSLLATFGTLFSSTIVAYGFARHDFRGNRTLLAILLSTMLLPGIVLMVPSFLMFKTLGWIDTYLPLVVPTFFAVSAGTVFLLRQRIRTIPQVLFEAGVNEGFNTYHVLRYIILPELSPLLTTMGILHFITHWNDLIGPLIYINTFEKKTLSLGLTYFSTQFSTNITLMMAASLVVSIPTILIFAINQKKIIRGIDLIGARKRPLS